VTVANDEIYEKYLQKAITESNALGDELAQAAGGARVPVLGSGHPLADVFLLKYSPKASELQEGVAFYGRAGNALLKSLQRLHVDPMAIYGTNCLKFAGGDEEESRPFLLRELHIVQPKLVVAMGEPAVAFLNSAAFPLSRELEPRKASSRSTRRRSRARHARHRRVARRAAGEDGVLERLQGARRVVEPDPPY
jgi:uracil-DNA glycosylase